MARQPEVFVRELDPAEAQRLVKITRTARDRVRLRRAGIVLASMQGRSPAEAAGMFAATAQYAREVIHAFNEQGFAALDADVAETLVGEDRVPMDGGRDPLGGYHPGGPRLFQGTDRCREGGRWMTGTRFLPS